ncbi:hypothetical protein BH24BAC1_BH24BAC1_29940 [soil metagenome]
MYKLIFVLGSVLLLLSSPAFGQQEDDSYQRELSYGINFNTNSRLIGGLMVKSTHRLRDKWYQFGVLEIVEIQHPKEQVLFNQETGGTFIKGKQNYLFSVRPQYGREHVLFKKAPESGVQVNALFAGGPTIGLFVPYLINYDYGTVNGSPTTLPHPAIGVRTEQYNPSIHKEENTLGKAGVFRGLSQTNLQLGANVKAAVSFEYGRYREGVTGVETGVVVEMYPGRPVLIPEAKNNVTYTSLYLTLYYGRRK